MSPIIEGRRVAPDDNHPFAGRIALFRVMVTGVREAAAERNRSGSPGDSRPPLN